MFRLWILASSCVLRQKFITQVPRLLPDGASSAKTGELRGQVLTVSGRVLISGGLGGAAWNILNIQSVFYFCVSNPLNLPEDLMSCFGNLKPGKSR